MSDSIHFTVAAGDEVPIYRQIVRQVRQAIAGGRLKTGDRLPSQRELGSRLVVAPLTIKKAYDELEREGLIRTARGQGTFVAAELREVDRAETIESVREAARRLVHAAHLAGVDARGLTRLVKEERDRLETERRAQEDSQERTS